MMDVKRQEELLRALEIISDCLTPVPKAHGDVPTHHFFKMKSLAALALRSPESLDGFYAKLESEEWVLPIPYDSVKQMGEEG
jgi:hypothetical protein